MKRGVKETGIIQGEEEELIYCVTTTPWGSNPFNVVVKAYDESDALKDVTATVLDGAATISGDVITTPAVKDLSEDHTYRIEIKFTSGANIYETYFYIVGER
ncbi:hypothetical protein KKH23_07485 [Patescibacteria group bacterium]|nr:hypothetical protein [Patescibacteria group bacterium]